MSLIPENLFFIIQAYFLLKLKNYESFKFQKIFYLLLFAIDLNIIIYIAILKKHVFYKNVFSLKLFALVLIYDIIIFLFYFYPKLLFVTSQIITISCLLFQIFNQSFDQNG